MRNGEQKSLLVEDALEAMIEDLELEFWEAGKVEEDWLRGELTLLFEQFCEKNESE